MVRKKQEVKEHENIYIHVKKETLKRIVKGLFTIPFSFWLWASVVRMMSDSPLTNGTYDISLSDFVITFGGFIGMIIFACLLFIANYYLITED